MSESPPNGLNGLDNRINDRGFFERILSEFKETLAVRTELLDERFRSQEQAIKKAEDRLDGTLKGFPQEYARRLELEQMIAALDETSTVLAQKVVDSATALAEAQKSAEQRVREEKDKTDARVDERFRKIESFQARLGGIAVAAPVLMSIVTALVILQFNG